MLRNWQKNEENIPGRDKDLGTLRWVCGSKKLARRQFVNTYKSCRISFGIPHTKYKTCKSANLAYGMPKEIRHD